MVLFPPFLFRVFHRELFFLLLLSRMYKNRMGEVKRRSADEKEKDQVN